MKVAGENIFPQKVFVCSRFLLCLLSKFTWNDHDLQFYSKASK